MTLGWLRHRAPMPSESETSAGAPRTWASSGLVGGHKAPSPWADSEEPLGNAVVQDEDDPVAVAPEADAEEPVANEEPPLQVVGIDEDDPAAVAPERRGTGK